MRFSALERSQIRDRAFDKIRTVHPLIPMGKEEKLLEYWRELSLEEQDLVLKFTQSLQANRRTMLEPLTVRSQEQLEELLLQGLNSLDEGNAIEVTNDWWEQKRQSLIAKQNQQKQ